MPETTPQRLLQLDAALRTPGGLADLIQHTPDTEDWLAWIIQAVKTPTCGALDEMRDERELLQAASTFTADGLEGLEACPVQLVDADQKPLAARQVAGGVWRFMISSPGALRLFTPDRMLLWDEDLVAGRDNPDDPTVWHLAATSEPTGPLVRRWTIPQWMLVVEHLQTAAGHWLDVIDHGDVA